MNWRPTVTRETLMRRAAILAGARAFFAARRILEVETPILSAAAVSDPQLESLATHVAGFANEFFLQTSPEYSMKRLLAAGSGDIYQVCKVFRNEQQGRWHNPEFTMIEWYRIGFDDTALMDEVEALIGAVLKPQRTLPPAERLNYSTALERHAGVNTRSSDAELTAAAHRHGIHCDAQLDRDATLDLLMGVLVGPRLGRDRPCFVCDYPASQAALARLKPGQPPVAARFELYLDGIELANGFQELQDAAEQRTRFNQDLSKRADRGQVCRPVDEKLLAALEHGLPDCAGVALGFDRLVAVALGADAIEQAMAYTVDNA